MEDLVKEASEFIDADKQQKDVAALKKIFFKYIEIIHSSSNDISVPKGSNLACNKAIWLAAQLNRGKTEYSPITVSSNQIL